MWIFFHRLLSPQYFYHFTGRLMPWLSVACLILFGYGLIGGLWLAPADYQQGDGFRIIYIHVPSAFLSMMVYMVMAVAATMSLIWRIKLADLVVSSSAALGAWFTALALISGSLWGKPMWGTWWIWDARLTSELILLFLYLGLLGLQAALQGKPQAARTCNILVLVGVVNIPIIHYSVYWWNTLHQGATLKLLDKPSIAPSMLYPLLAMLAAFVSYYLIILLMRMRSEIMWREKQSQWVTKILSEERGVKRSHG